MRIVWSMLLIFLIILITSCTTPTANEPEVKDEMVLIPAKGQTFQMGAHSSFKDEAPIRAVTFTHDFYMDQTEVTQRSYNKLLKTHSTSFEDDDKPVTLVNWHHAVAYCNTRSKKEGLDTVYSYDSIDVFTNIHNTDYYHYGLKANFKKNGYRLPTEAEWEFACRAGTTTKYYWGDNFDSEYAWFRNNSTRSPNRVKTRFPNAFGLYDMAGNVQEWCSDWYDRYKKSDSPLVDPLNDTYPDEDSDLAKVVRGGSWDSTREYLHSSNRFWQIWYDASRTVGFRCVRKAD